MQKMKYRFRFLTPAFLGNVEQSGQWRTPPFKALLRQWWRVVWAARHGFPEDFAQMRLEEGRLFGNAWIEGDFRKSAVRMRLSKRCASPELKGEGEGWTTGSLTRNQWGRQKLDGKIRHPEVNQPVGPLLYLGYGPLKVEAIRKSGGRKEYATVLKGNAAIQAGEAAELSIAAPESDVADIRSALSLMNAYGTVGGRSRNGWGSSMIQPLDDSPSVNASADTSRQGAGKLDRSFLRPWRDALALDWPHVIGADETGPLVWRTSESYDDWKTLMRDLAILKIGLRTMFAFPSARPPHDRLMTGLWNGIGCRIRSPDMEPSSGTGTHASRTASGSRSALIPATRNGCVARSPTSPAFRRRISGRVIAQSRQSRASGRRSMNSSTS